MWDWRPIKAWPTRCDVAGCGACQMSRISVFLALFFAGCIFPCCGWSATNAKYYPPDNQVLSYDCRDDCYPVAFQYIENEHISPHSSNFNTEYLKRYIIPALVVLIIIIFISVGVGTKKKEDPPPEITQAQRDALKNDIEHVFAHALDNATVWNRPQAIPIIKSVREEVTKLLIKAL